MIFKLNILENEKNKSKTATIKSQIKPDSKSELLEKDRNAPTNSKSGSRPNRGQNLDTSTVNQIKTQNKELDTSLKKEPKTSQAEVAVNPS